MAKNSSISQDKLDNVCRSLKESDFKTTEEKEWIKQFNDTPLVIRREMINLLEKEQTKSIIKSIHSLDNNISVMYLGTFSIKKSWKEFIFLCRENPNTPVEEIVEIVKSRHKERRIKKKKKSKLNLSIVKNETSS